VGYQRLFHVYCAIVVVHSFRVGPEVAIEVAKHFAEDDVVKERSSHLSWPGKEADREVE